MKLDSFEKKIDSISTDVNSLKKDLDKRISVLEKFFWLISIIGSILFFGIQNIEKIKNLFQ